MTWLVWLPGILLSLVWLARDLYTARADEPYANGRPLIEVHFAAVAYTVVVAAWWTGWPEGSVTGFTAGVVHLGVVLLALRAIDRWA